MYSFARYAAQNLSFHLRRLQPSLVYDAQILQPLAELLGHPQKLNFIVQRLENFPMKRHSSFQLGFTRDLTYTPDLPYDINWNRAYVEDYDSDHDPFDSEEYVVPPQEPGDMSEDSKDDTPADFDQARSGHTGEQDVDDTDHETSSQSLSHRTDGWSLPTHFAAAVCGYPGSTRTGLYMNKASGVYDSPLSRRPTSDYDTTPLHLAAHLGWDPIVLWSVKACRNLDLEDAFGNTPLVVAIQAESWSAIPILLEHGARVDLDSPIGCAIILKCAEENKKEVIRDLLLRELEALAPEVGLIATITRVLFMAVNIAKRTLFRCGTIRKNLGNLDPDLDPTWHLQIFQAAESGDSELLKHLPRAGESGAIVQKTSMTIYTALFFATELGHNSVVKALIENSGHDIDVNARGLRRTTLLHRATRRNNLDLVRYLLNHSADVNAEDDVDQTAWSANLKREHLQGDQNLVTTFPYGD